MVRAIEYPAVSISSSPFSSQAPPFACLALHPFHLSPNHDAFARRLFCSGACRADLHDQSALDRSTNGPPGSKTAFSAFLAAPTFSEERKRLDTEHFESEIKQLESGVSDLINQLGESRMTKRWMA